MTRTKPAEQRRADLLAAGRTLFLAKGIAATSLDDITRQAGVSKGLFYLYFASKEDLVLALQEQFSGEVAAVSKYHSRSGCFIGRSVALCTRRALVSQRCVQARGVSSR